MSVGQREFNMSIVRTINSIAALRNSRSGAILLRFGLSDSALLNAHQNINVVDLLTI